MMLNGKTSTAGALAERGACIIKVIVLLMGCLKDCMVFLCPDKRVVGTRYPAKSQYKKR